MFFCPVYPGIGYIAKLLYKSFHDFFYKNLLPWQKTNGF
jgi:hypothetical protein